MYKRWSGEVEITDEKTGEVVGRKRMCVQAEEGVPMGSEAGFREVVAPDFGESLFLLFMIIVMPLFLVIGLVAGIIGLIKSLL